MKHFEIKRLIGVALVAGLPIACGSSLPTGPDVTVLDGGATVSGLRSEPGLPPTAPGAPEAPSPETVPAPVPDKGDPTDDNLVPVIDPLPEHGTVPAIPTPQPDDDAGSIPLPPGARPVPVPAAPATNVPPPPWPGDGYDGARQCLAGMAEIMILRGNLPLPLAGESVLLEMLLLGKDALPVPEGTCQGIAWSFLGEKFSGDATIKVAANTRFATVSGQAGDYMIRATAPNGQSATVAIRLP